MPKRIRFRLISVQEMIDGQQCPERWTVYVPFLHFFWIKMNRGQAFSTINQAIIAVRYYYGV